MWAFPFGAGLALFGADLIVFVLGDDWRGAIVLLGGMAVAVALQQVGYSWFAFYRARGESWPQAVESAVFGAAFLVLGGAGALLAGRGGSWSGGSAAPSACCSCAALCAAAAAGRAVSALALRAAVPVALASAPVLALRLALWGGERTLWQALLELALWLAGWRSRRTGSSAGCSPSCAATCARAARRHGRSSRGSPALARGRGRSPASRCGATSGRWTRAS